MLAKPTTNEAQPRFEYYPLDSPKLQCVEIDHFPFVIGRAATASFPINSTSVSREHAVVDRTPTGYCLRDLGSTNGTSLNGAAVNESPLSDGDTVTIADIELTFVCSPMGRLQRTLTKPLPGRKPIGVVPGTTPELAAARGLNEALLLQAIPLDSSYLVSPNSHEPLASISRVSSPLLEALSQADAKRSMGAAARLELLAWKIAVEQQQDQPKVGGLLVSLVHRESLDGQLPEVLCEIEQRMAIDRPLGVCVPWEWATATSSSLQLIGQLKQQGRTIAFHDFSGGGDCIASMDEATPDYLLLSKQVTSRVAEQTRRLQRLEIVQAACHTYGIEIVLPRNISGQDQAACEEIGIAVVESERTTIANQLEPSPA